MRGSHSVLTIGAFIITKNEERMLPGCLQSLVGFDEVLVLDSGSDDRTIEIASELGASCFVNRDWCGFGIQKQRALAVMKSDVVLSIDADERATQHLIDFLTELKRGNQIYPQASAFNLRRSNYILGSRVNWGYFRADFPLRLGYRERVRFDERPLHERMHAAGQVVTLPFESLEHHTRPTIRRMMEKQVSYACIGPEADGGNSSWRAVLGACVAFCLTFTSAYFFRLGFLDGAVGLLAAISRAQTRFWRELYRGSGET